MPLEGEGRYVGAGDALIGAVKKRYVRYAQIARQGRRVDRKTMILTGDQHVAGFEVLDRVVRAMVA